MKILMIKVKVTSLTTAVSLKCFLKNNKVNLYYQKKQSKRLCSVQLKRGTIAVGVQSLEDIAYENDASKSTSSQFS
jgi:hypothetical protein